MTIFDRFRDGGWGMYPTLVFGLVLLATSIRFAQSSERRLVPLLVVLNWLTLTSGALGFLTGLVATARARRRGLMPDQIFARSSVASAS